MASIWVGVGAALASLGVMTGAFGAHALKARVSPEMLVIWETANRYHMYHALGLILVGLLADRLSPPVTTASGWCLTVGVLIFSGSLYVMSLTGLRWLGAITPLGGLAFIIGWAVLALGALRS